MFEYISTVLREIKIADIVDIGIIALFLYIVLVWLERARAKLILIGIVILSLLYIVARVFNLHLTILVFQAFFAIFLILLAIIFQDDLRHFLERLGLWGVRTKYPPRQALEENAQMLSSSLVNLSRKQIGALVVIKGKDPLDRHIKVGVELNGLLNQFILEAIFEPHAPTHDGAVVVERDKIIAFGCHLPLSTNIQQVGRLGTRHAAALGLSERSDSLCIVVSEERGTISIAQAGRLQHVEQISDLNKIISDFYQRQYPLQRKFTLMNFVMRNLTEKVMAAVLAVILWLTFGYQPKTIIRRDFVIPIEYRNLSADWVIGEPKPKELTVTLSGRESAFSLFDSKELKVSIDMSKVKEGENEYFLNKEMIKHPNNLSLVNIEPNVIKLNAYRMLLINIPIQLKTVGRPSAGINLKEIKVSPKEIAVLVPSIIPPEKVIITTEAIDLQTVNETTTFSPKIILPPEVRLAQDKYPQISVTIEVEKKQ